MEELKLNERDQQRLQALLELDAGRLELEDVASELENSPRQIRRMLKRFKLEGPAAVVHGNRGRAPGITKPAALREQVIHLYKTKYIDFNFVQFTQMLEEREGIFLSVSTVRSWLLAAGLKPPRQQRRPRKRSRRQRYPSIGMLIQMDASTEDWLEGRGPKLCLFLAIDDASSRAWAWFGYTENAEGYFTVMRHITATAGIPLAVYVDRHSIFGKSKRFSDRETKFAWTQFSRLCKELGVHLIKAWSPQAKGRVERDIQTFQDRLGSLLRLEKVDNIKDANRVLRSMLRDFNVRFSCAPAEEKPEWRSWPSEHSRDEVFCFKFRRTVAKDNTVRFEGKTFDLDNNQNRAKQKVTVCQTFDGSIRFLHDGAVVGNAHAQRRPLSDTPAPPELTIAKTEAFGIKKPILRQMQQNQATENPSEAREKEA